MSLFSILSHRAAVTPRRRCAAHTFPIARASAARWALCLALSGLAVPGWAADADATGTDGQARSFSHRHSLPVWEVGAGLSGITLPDYRGSARQRQYLLPFPMFVYRSPHLRLSQEQAARLTAALNGSDGGAD